MLTSIDQLTINITFQRYLTKGELARWSMVMRGLLTIYKTKWTSDEIEQGVLADLILDLQNTIIV